MAYTPKDNSGSLFINDNKQTDNHPDRTGSIMVAGVEYYLNGWLKKTQDGKPYLSLSLKPKAEKAPGASIKRVMDNEVPF